MGVQSPRAQASGDAPGDAARIRSHLRRVLGSPSFRASERGRTFLEYVVEKVLQGQAENLKERTIAIDVFGRPSDANLTEDTIVRVSAREVRRRLAEYYATPQGVADEIRIALPIGTYVPEVRPASRSVAERQVASPDPVHDAPFKLGVLVAMAIAFVAILATVAFRLSFAPPHQGSFESFWNPVLGAGNSVLIVVAHPIVYQPSERAERLSDSRNGARPVLQRAIELPPDELDGSDLVPVFNQFVGFGDLLASSELHGLLAARKKTVRLRMASSVEFVDLKESPTILIGAFTNRWTVELVQDLHFRFGWSPHRIPEIVEFGGTRRWALQAAPADGRSEEDFILVSRVLESSIGRPLVVLAGLKQFGTGAAGHLLADPAQWNALSRLLPGGWETKSLQVVLHAKVIGAGPITPTLLASYTW